MQRIGRIARIRLAATLAAVTALLVAAPVGAEGTGAPLSDADRDRLAAFDRVRTEAIAAARRDGDPAEVAELDAILAGSPQPILGEDLRGDFRCRIAKLDGILPLVVYDWFRCRIAEDERGYVLEKTTGSQRSTLRFVDERIDRLVAYGAEHYADEAPLAYGADPDRDMVGHLVKPEGGRYRVEFPLPRRESRFDVLELERRD